MSCQSSIQVTLHVNHYPIKTYPSLIENWTDLFARAKTNVFLAPTWLEAWIAQAPDSLLVVEARHNTQVVGLAVFNQHQVPPLCKGFSTKQLWLHKTGQHQEDQMWIEHNDFLLDSQNADAIRAAMLNYIHQHLTWDELYLGMATDNTTQRFLAEYPYARKLLASPDYSVDLSNFRSLDDYLKTLSKNTRAQIKRSLKLLQQTANISLVRATSEPQKNRFFDSIQAHHVSKWRETDLGSGFDNPIFVNFHRKLIFEDPLNYYTELFGLSIDGELVALAYILKSPETWYFYLSGIQTHTDNRIKYGLLMHSLIIEQAIQQGIRKYSFLAGYARYKASLSNVTEPTQYMTCFYRSAWRYRLITGLSKIKRKLALSSKT